MSTRSLIALAVSAAAVTTALAEPAPAMIPGFPTPAGAAQATTGCSPTPAAPAQASGSADEQIGGGVSGSADIPACEWRSYAQRYAIVVMGGNVSGQMYKWYWNDTSGQVWAMMDWGFAPEDIFYLSYGDSADAHPELADTTSTYVNVKAAFDTVAARATPDDLVHVWWVDHGNTSGFEVHNGFVYFTELKQWIDAIECKAYIGAYNPCYSGAIMPHMAGLGSDERWVITATSVRANQPNSYGWAGAWRTAMRGGRPDGYAPWFSDKSLDGFITIDEAYEWEAPHSNASGEYPLLDDNCDGLGGDFTNPATYDSSGTDPLKDGYESQFFSLMAWCDRETRSRGLSARVARPPAVGIAARPPLRTRQAIEIEWSVGAPMPRAVSRGASGLIGDKIYLFGGHPTPAPIHYAYDIAADSWSAGCSRLPVYGSLTRGVVHDGKLYVFGGHTLGSDDMQRYDPAADSWETLSSPYPTSARECCKYGASVVGDRIYYHYVEERYTYCPVLTSWQYDIAGDSWVEEPAPPAPRRMYAASASDGGYCYMIGGLAHDADLSVLDQAMRYDPSTRGWEDIDPLPEPIAFADGDFHNGRLFIAGGGAGYGRWPASDRVYCRTEELGWVEGTPLPAPVGSPHVELATIGDVDYIFAFGGYNGDYLNTLFIGRIGELTCVGDDEPAPGPSAFALFQNHPNPFNPTTEIAYAIPTNCHVSLCVHNASGQKVATLVDGVEEAGYRQVRWDARPLASGIYFCRLEAGGFVDTRKMVLLE